MTKIILIGGYPSHAPDNGRSLCNEMTAEFPEPVKILDVLFARPSQEWDATLKSDQEFFQRNLQAKQFKLTMAHPEVFARQVAESDIVYLRGGDTAPLMNVLRANPEWLRHINGKIIAGTSAGAYALCKYYHELNALGVQEGLSLLPYKILTHWESAEYGTPAQWHEYEQELKAYGNTSLPLLKLREGELRIFEIGYERKP